MGLEAKGGGWVSEDDEEPVKEAEMDSRPVQIVERKFEGEAIEQCITCLEVR